MGSDRHASYAIFPVQSNGRAKMSLKFTFLGRNKNRWRIRLECPVPVRGVTAGLMAEDGRPLGPAVVMPGSALRVFEMELRGPCALPAGTVVRCTADPLEGPTLVDDFPTHARQGLHAFLHADVRLPVESIGKWGEIGKAERKQLSRLLPWLAPAPAPKDFDCPDSLDKDLLRMLREDFDVDLSEDTDLSENMGFSGFPPTKG